ncbi:hypothetical protein CI102_6085 [Trichoderma harzianum]|nr:hypothetical protein CI102_6085 [Trichoderma harzianum]
MASGNMIFSLILPNVHNVLVANVSEHFHHARAQLEPYTSYVYGVTVEAMHEWRKWVPIADCEAVIGPEPVPVQYRYL